ncbi:DUF6801 domain-containing protein [Kibdelosporangium phytohabitans]|nr:DUF6801 domain-containing protein [Kibdelosporangium phytohabitans]MBE1462329.1 hypothetical protein [Kibdelosporangium phytohabitans]
MSHRKRAGLAVMLAAVTIAAPPTMVTAAGGDQVAAETRVVKPIRATCDIDPVGDQAITAELALTLPATVPTATPVQPKDVKLKVTFPAGTVKALKEKLVSSIEGIMGVQVKSGDRVLAATGQLPSTTLPAEDGDVVVEQALKPGTEFKTDKPGKLVLTLGALEMLLVQPKTREEDPGKPVAPAGCVLEQGQDTALGTVVVLNPPPTTVTTSKPSTSASGLPTAPGASPQSPQGTQRPTVRDKKPQRNAAEEPEFCKDVPPDAYNFWVYYPLSGRADVRKLKGHIDFGPGYLSSQLYFWWEMNGEEMVDCGAVFGDLVWPPAPGSFVTFGFVPVTATATVIPVGRAEGRVKNGVFTGSAKTDLKLSDSKVNGTPLPVGDKCVTAEPTVINLKSKPEEWTIFDGGIMETDIIIPPYSGCGVTEDLDPLLTGLISGPGNHLKLTFGALVNCDPPDQKCVPPSQRRR